MESENGKCLIYKNQKSQDYLKKQIGFIKVRDLIVSPGHCLIKKQVYQNIGQSMSCLLIRQMITFYGC